MISRKRYLLRNLVFGGIGLGLALWLGGAAQLNLPTFVGLLILLFLIGPQLVIPDELPAGVRAFVRDPMRLSLFVIVYCTAVVLVANAMTGNWIWREPDGSEKGAAAEAQTAQ